MATSPLGLPSGKDSTAADFWNRAEGKFGKGILYGVAALLGVLIFFFFGEVSGFVMNTLSNLISIIGQLAVIGLIGVLFFFLVYLFHNPMVRLYFKTRYQAAIEAMWYGFIKKKPLAILQSNITDMEQTQGQYEGMVSGVSGKKTLLENKLKDKKEAVLHWASMVASTDEEIANMKRQLASLQPTDPAYLDLNLKINRYNLRSQEYAVTMGMEKKGIGVYEDLLRDTTTMYQLLVRYSDRGEYNINVSKKQLELWTDQYNTVVGVSDATGKARKMLKADPAKARAMELTLQFLVEDTAARKGDMMDFARFGQRYLDDMDIEQGAAANDAKSSIADFEKRLAAPAQALSLVAGDDGVLVPVKSQTVAQPLSRTLSSSSYDDVFGK